MTLISPTALDVRPRAAPHIRVATATDDAAVRRVITGAYRQYETVLPPALFTAYLADLLDLDARVDSGVLLVAEVDGSVAGAVTFYPDAAAQGFGWPSGWAGFRALAVAPTHRHLGIAGHLVDACIERAERLGALSLCLHTASFMAAAVHLYERRGFTRIPAFDLRVEDVIGVGGSDVPAVVAYRRVIRARRTWACVDPI